MKVFYFRAWVFLLFIMACIGGEAILPNRMFAETFTISDQPTDYAMPEEKPVFSGNQMVWLESSDPSRVTDVFTRNMATGDLKRLTDSYDYKERLSAGGDYAVYLENKQNVVLIHLPTGESRKTAIKPDYYYDIRTDGQYIVYRGNDRTLHLYNISNEQETVIGTGSGAAIVNGVVVYVNSSEGGMELYDAGNGTIRRLITESNGHFSSASPLAFNGKQVVWLHGSSSGDYQIRTINIDEPNPTPQVLSVFKEPSFDSSIFIGSHTAAWREGWYKTPQQVVVVDLASRQTEAFPIKEKQFLGMVNDQLVLRGDNDKLALRTLEHTGQGQVVTETLVSAVPSLDFEPKRAECDVTESSYVITEDKQASVSHADGNHSKPGKFNPFARIEYAKDEKFALSKALRSGQMFVSHPWSIELKSIAGPVKLSLSYIEQRVPSGGKEKLGIYRLDSNGWVYMGGLFDQSGKYIYTDIIKSGIYVVLYQDVPGQSVRDYYLQQRIKELNANKPIRVFLEGEELNFDESPILKDGSTTVQFRPIFEKLGLQIQWDPTTQRITGSKSGQSLQLTVGHTMSQVNGESVELPVAPFLQDGNTFVPLRFVGEATGLKVLWDENLKAVYLYDPATEGKIYYDNGVLKYEGQMKNGLMHGKGKLYRSDGSLWYDAEFQDNEVQGWGTLYFAGFHRERDRTGEVSIGQFAHGRPEGYVVDIDDNGYVAYEGQVIQGIFNGQGKYYEIDELLYEGEFKDNNFDGYGKLYSDGRLQYEGQFVKNLFHGKGKEYNPDESLWYESEYANGMRNGKGKKYFKSGAISYEGEYVDDIPSKGTIYYPNGKAHVEFTMVNNTYTGTIYYENGEKYVGEFWMVNLNRNGQGTLYDKQGNIIYQGTFQYDKPLK